MLPHPLCDFGILQVPAEEGERWVAHPPLFVSVVFRATHGMALRLPVEQGLDGYL